MKRRFVIGEVRSDFFGCRDEQYRQETLDLLMSEDLQRQAEGIGRHVNRKNYFAWLPSDIEWSIAMLAFTEDDFRRLKTINDSDWVSRTKATRRIADAAEWIASNPDGDPRVQKVIGELGDGRLELRGITLLGNRKDRDLTIVEGTARLIAFYLCHVRGKSDAVCPREIEVVLGFTDTHWAFG